MGKIEEPLLSNFYVSTTGTQPNGTHNQNMTITITTIKNDALETSPYDTSLS